MKLTGTGRQQYKHLVKQKYLIVLQKIVTKLDYLTFDLLCITIEFCDVEKYPKSEKKKWWNVIIFLEALGLLDVVWITLDLNFKSE